MMTTEGLNEIRDLIATDIDKGQAGTGTTAAQTDDTSLETAVAGTQLASTDTSTSRQISSQVTATSVDGNTNNLTEFALQRSTATTVDFTRDVFTSITKDIDTDIRFTKILFIDGLQQA